jgi:hypothetical protein
LTSIVYAVGAVTAIAGMSLLNVAAGPSRRSS